MDSIIKVVPIVDGLEANTKEEKEANRKLEIVNVEVTNSSTKLNDIERVLSNNYVLHLMNVNVEVSTKDALSNKLVLDCEKLSYLEANGIYPKLSYVYDGYAAKVGTLHINEKEAKNVVSLKYLINNENKNRQDIQKFQEMLLNLLKMQNLPGIPRVYAVCITKNQSLTKGDAHDKINSLPFTIR